VIRPELDAFFAQHVARWAVTPSPSLFHDPTQRRFYERLTEEAAEAGWLRFTRVDWNGQPIAFHFGFCYGGSYLWYKPSFDIAWARRSPGEVLLRQLFCAAMAEGAHTFDFGLGDEPFKRRFATQINRVHTWGLYPET
jgi:CelD/BcsL family acetyltransferase involved in cellulose biosynthesis